MPTLRDWILRMADGEPVDGVVIGEMGWGDYGSERVPNYAEQPRDQLLTWDQALSFIQYEFDDGYGAPSCNKIYAWTKSWVISVCQYDGSTYPFRIPRNPRACVPDMVGGG